MSGIDTRLRMEARVRADAQRERLAARLRNALPGVTVAIEGDAIRLSGRGVQRRWDDSNIDFLLRSDGP